MRALFRFVARRETTRALYPLVAGRETMRALYLLVASLALMACSAAPPLQHATPGSPPGRAGMAPVAYPPDFAQALALGTRATNGAPGPAYWQNFATYRIRARLDPEEKQLEANAEIEYRNNSPDTIETLHLELPQNLHAEGVIRFEETEVTGGVDVRTVSVGGRELGAEGSGPRYGIFGTRLMILPPRPLAPGQTARIAIDYAFDLPQSGAGGRMGYSGDDVLYLAYWYPQMAVYDDVIGWHPDPFVGTTEFYADFASYQYEIDVPAGWLVLGTGEWQNPEQLLTSPVRERLRRAAGSDSVIAIASPRDFAARVTTGGSSGRLVWKLRADSVRDVAFAVVRNVHWDARRTMVGDRDGDGSVDATRIDAIYRASAPRWKQAADYGAHAIRFLSGYTAMPYPWPHMSIVEGGGIIGGGMEYPMMTLIGDYNRATDADLYSVVAHELAHMWVPMLVGTDERRFSWMDEGTTTFNENMARADFMPGQKPWLGEHAQYRLIAGSGEEGELMRRSAFHYSGAAFGIASYSKPASVLVALRAVLGEETFMRGYHSFLQQWKYRHPYPWDFFNTFESASGRDLDWFWRSWYYETGVLDQAVGEVRARGGRTQIVVENRGQIPMPVSLRVTLANGATQTADIPVEHWLAGHREAQVSIETASPAVRVEIDPEQFFPDIDRSNNVWTRTEAEAERQ